MSTDKTASCGPPMRWPDEIVKKAMDAFAACQPPWEEMDRTRAKLRAALDAIAEDVVLREDSQPLADECPAVTDWQEKAKRAIRIRKITAKYRRGKSISFPTDMQRRTFDG